MLDTPVLEPAVLDGVTRADEFERSSGAVAGGSLLEGLETTSFSAPEPSSAPRELLDFEPTSFAPELVVPPAPPAAVPVADDLLDFDLQPAAGFAAREAEPSVSLVDFGEIDLSPPDFDQPPPPPHRPSRPSLLGLPMLVDEDGEEPVAEDDGSTIGGDLELIMPERRARRSSAATMLPMIRAADGWRGDALPR